jgi:hypothetical protein
MRAAKAAGVIDRFPCGRKPGGARAARRLKSDAMGALDELERLFGW